MPSSLATMTIRKLSTWIPATKFSATPFAVLLIFSALLRFACAFLSTGSEHPTEFYRLLEPIIASMGYSARLPWEWRDGLLSPLPVLFFGKIIACLVRLTWLDPYFQAIALRLIFALISLAPIWATWRAIFWAGGSARA